MDIYEEALSLVSEGETSTLGDIFERKAYALYKMALQAENVDEFGRSAERAVRAYEEARSEYRKVADSESMARANRCEAMHAFIGFLSSTDADHRRKTALGSWNHARESLDAFAALGDMHEFCKTFYDLSLGAIYYSNLVPDYQTRKRAWAEVTSCGEKAAAFARCHEDQNASVRILVLVSALLTRGGFCNLCEGSPRHCYDLSLELWQAAESMSKEEVLSGLPMAWITGDAPIDPNREAANELLAFRKALELVRDSKDKLVIGHALAGVSFYAHWIGADHADKEQEDALMAESLESALEARSEFLKIGFLAETGHNIWVMSPQTEYCGFRAFYENDLKKKRELAERGLEALPEYTELASLAGYSWQNLSVDMIAGSLLHQLARTEADVSTKRTMLQRAVDHFRKSVELLERWEPETPFNIGVWKSNLACIQADLAEATTDKDTKAKALREAIGMQMKAIEKFEEGMKSSNMTRDQSTVATLGWFLDQLGRRYCGLFELESSSETLRHALQCFERAGESYLRSDRPSRAAESLWEAARIYDQLDDPVSAAEGFLSASMKFRVAAEKIPRLKDLFLEQATYLEAWAEFEKAKYHHSRQEYQQAINHFDKAAQLHEELEKWRFLAFNYHAWALIDSAEALSREDRRGEASKAFAEAAALFEKSGTALDEAGRTAKNADEKRMIARLLSASKPRREYCLARAMIEEARQMDVEGMSSSSSDMYKMAADELERLADESPSERDRTDIRLLAVLSRAWQKMNQAEAEVSPEPYADAALLFEQAKELSKNDRAKSLALGHSRFCRALEAGAKFADTREPALHASAIKSLESASAFYVKADADRCSEYARASKLLFDAYAYLADAGQEKEQEKAAKTYARAERVLQASSESYERAGQPGKRDQVLKLRDRVNRERELAVSLMDVLEAPTGASSTNAFGAPTPSQEEAVGLDRFAHADVQATLIVQRRDVKVGEDMNVEIELVNAGRASAQLTKVENIIPSGFEVRSKPANYRIEDSYIMMKGKRLDPLKTEEIALVLKPTVQGRFQLRPRILYLDDEGRYKAQEVEACYVTVKELGVTGWLKGPERKS